MCFIVVLYPFLSDDEAEPRASVALFYGHMEVSHEQRKITVNKRQNFGRAEVCALLQAYSHIYEQVNFSLESVSQAAVKKAN